MECSVSRYFDRVGAVTFTALSMFRMDENAKKTNFTGSGLKLRTEETDISCGHFMTLVGRKYKIGNNLETFSRINSCLLKDGSAMPC